MLSQIRSFLGAVPGSIQGHINTQELLRVAILAAIAAAPGGGLAAILLAVSGDLPNIITNPADMAMASAALTLATETYRRFGHGAPLPPATLPFRRAR